MKNYLHLLALLLATVLPAAGMAATNYGIYVAGVPVTSDNARNITGSDILSGYATYDASKNMLTLNNMEIDTKRTAINVTSSAPDRLHIVLNGENVVKMQSGAPAAFVIYKPSASTSSSYVNCYIEGKGTLTMANGEIMCMDAPWICIGNGVQGGEGYGGPTINTRSIYCRSNSGSGVFSISDGSVNLSGFSYGTLYNFRSVFISGTDMGIYTPQGASYDSDKMCLLDSDGQKVTGPVYMGWRLYGLTVGGKEVTAGNKDHIQSPRIKYGTASYNPASGELTLPENADIYTFDGIGPAIANRTGKALTIRCTGNSYTNIGCTSADKCPAITSTEDVTIIGTENSRLQIQGETALNIEGETGKTISIKTFRQVLLFGHITLGDGTLAFSDITETSIDTERYGAPAFAQLKLENMEITTSKVFFDSQRRYFRQSGSQSSYSGMVRFAKVTQTYGIRVGGHEVNNLNANNFYYENISGSVHYAADTLLLDGVTIDCQYRYSAIQQTTEAKPGMFVKLLGNNSVKNNPYGRVTFVAYRSPIILGPGTLTLAGTIYCYDGSNITFRDGCTVNGTQLVNNSIDGTLRLQDCQLNLSGSEYGTLHGFDRIELNHVFFVIPTGATYDADSRYLLSADGSRVTGRVSIGSVTIDDITSLISAYLSPEASSPRYADMNGDGQISVDDITALIDAYLNVSD